MELENCPISAEDPDYQRCECVFKEYFDRTNNCDEILENDREVST